MRGGRGGLSVRLGRWYYAGTEEVRVVSEVSWQELTKSECFGLLAGQHLGRVVLVDDRGPIVVRGEATEITDPDELARVRQLPLSPWAPGAKTRYVRILPSSLTGRRIAVPRDTPWQWSG